MIKLSGIIFITTYNCNADCKHCFFDTQTAQHYLSPDIIDRVYADESITKHMFWNHLSGGEVFLQPEKLYEIIRTIRKYFTKDIGMSTNGFWAKTPEIAQKRVQELLEAGISGIAVSADTFHEEYIDTHSVAHAIAAVSTSGLQNHSYIMGARCAEDMLNAMAYNVLTDKLTNKVQASYTMPLAPTTIRSIGKGSSVAIPKKENMPQGICSNLCECLGARGPYNPSMVWVDVYGNVMVCYGIIIGNVYETDFAQIIREYKTFDFPLLHIIAEKGPHALIEIAKKEGIPCDALKFYDECDVCYTLRKLLLKYYSKELGPRECYP